VPEDLHPLPADRPAVPAAPPVGAPNPFAPPPHVRPVRPPLSVRLAALPRIAVTVAAALAGAWRVAEGLARVAARTFPESEPAPRLAALMTVGAMVLFLLGVWAWLEPTMVRARLGALARFGAGSIGCMVATYAVAALPLAYVGFFALVGTRGARSAFTVASLALVTPLMAWVPAFWLGELVQAVVVRLRRTGRPGECSTHAVS